MATAPRVLVVNCGSSSVKYRLLPAGGGAPAAVGLVERIGQTDARLTHRTGAGDGTGEDVRTLSIPDHAAALDAVLGAFAEHGPDLRAGLIAVGHRVVHGGARFARPTVIDDEVLAAVDDLAGLAPLHNPACATGIRAARALLPDVPHVAVFDTAFHRDMPARASTYAVPRAWREDLGVRRYGFHGTSHAYVSRRTAQLLGRPLAGTATIVLHLGNGASACAVDGGRSIDTSMGMTPLAGLVMGTRSGDVDPALPEYLHRVGGLEVGQIDVLLNSRSGLLGLAGASDMREVTARALAGDAEADLALDVFCYRVRCYVGAYLAALGRLDAIAFTGGIGEHAPQVRHRCLTGLDRLGIVLDPARNADGPAERVISSQSSPVTVLVVPTDEESEIAAQAAALVSARTSVGG